MCTKIQLVRLPPPPFSLLFSSPLFLLSVAQSGDVMVRTEAQQLQVIETHDVTVSYPKVETRPLRGHPHHLIFFFIEIRKKHYFLYCRKM